VLDYTICGVEETHASLRLETIDGNAVFTFWNPYPDTEADSFAAVAWRVEVLGGQIETRTFGDEGFELTLRFPLRSDATLTEREMEVMALLGEGMTNKEIADRLSLSPRTVNFHLDNIYTKLGVNSRTEAVVHALRHNWIRRVPAGNSGR
jgi:DNA-binding CsgD family transcriptional regulator